MRPIFIFGCDRSGTTLLGSLLGSHSRAVATPESQFVYEVYRDSLSRRGQVDPQEALSSIKNHFRFKVWNIEITPRDLPRLPRTYRELIEGIVKVYAGAVGRKEADIWVDHTPANCMFAHTLAQLYPEAKFIHIVRDGRAVASSLMALPWKFHSAHQVSEFWVRRVGQGLGVESHFGPSRCMRVNYEELVSSPESVLRELCSFAELEFEPQMLSGKGFVVPGYTVNEHALVGKAAEPARIHAWETKLSQRDIEIFESGSGNMLAYLGYAPKFGDHAKRQTRLERYWAAIKDVLFYRRYDGFKERRKRTRILEQMQAQGYLNRRPSLAMPRLASRPLRADTRKTRVLGRRVSSPPRTYSGRHEVK